MEKEVAFRKGLTPRTWVLVFITIVVQLVTTQLNHTMGNVWMYPGGLFPLTPALIIFFFHNILPGRWKLTKEELTIIVLVSFFNAQGFWMAGGYLSPYGGTAIMPGSGLISSAYIKSMSPYKESFAAFIPDWLAPSGNLDAVITGGALDWATWATPILFWSMIWIVYLLLGLMISFSLRRPFVETERLIFPLTVATYSLFDYQMEKEPGHKRVKMLDFGTAYAKAFWIGGSVGIIMGLTDVLNYFVPTIPASWEYAGNHVDLSGFFQQYAPGAWGNQWFWWIDFGVYAFVSLDILLTALIFNVLILMVYPALAVRLGWVSYVPGVENYSADQYGSVEGPFKFNYWITYGLMFGIGLWVAWNHRRHFINILQNAFGQATGPKEEDGVSYRFVGLGMSILWIVLLILWTAVGVPPVTAFVGLVLLVLYTLASSRVQAEMHIDDAQLYSVRGWLYDTGYATGSWGAAPVVSGELFKTMYVSSALTGISWSGLSPSLQLHGWKVGYETKTDPKEIMKALIVTAIVSIIFAHVFNLWWWSKAGGVTTSPGWTSYSDRAADSELYTLNTGHTLTAFERVWYAVTGTIFVFACFILRGRFPWFFINPVGVWTAVIGPCCHTWPMLGGLIYKYVIMKIGGTRLWQRVGVPAVVGFITTQTIGMFFFLAWIGFFQVSLPAAMAQP